MLKQRGIRYQIYILAIALAPACNRTPPDTQPSYLLTRNYPRLAKLHIVRS
jgi:hypothetical protein